SSVTSRVSSPLQVKALAQSDMDGLSGSSVNLAEPSGPYASPPNASRPKKRDLCDGLWNESGIRQSFSPVSVLLT
ncbi:MAG TPA: hypothetical protein VH022_02530, partial [Candidatus Acidoferrum sp.]|nr:hypothetical protein [Candidatus Acidoferrum sp.]